MVRFQNRNELHNILKMAYKQTYTKSSFPFKTEEKSFLKEEKKLEKKYYPSKKKGKIKKTKKGASTFDFDETLAKTK